MACRRRVWWKVWAISTLLRMLGKEKEAKKLVVGYDTFCVHNNSKTDRDLVFSTHALVALEAALAPAEASEYLLVWRPITKRSGSSSGSSMADSTKAKQQQQQQWAGRSEVQLAPVGGDVIWRRFLHTQMAGIYRMLFGIVPEQRKMMTSAAAAAAAGQECKEIREECFVEHDFRRIK
jgi:3-oxoacyl-(acyl-carrier-protein) synthase